MLEPQKANIFDSMPVILVSIPINELVPHVMDIDTKKLNFNSYLTHIFHVIFVNEKDIKTKFWI